MRFGGSKMVRISQFNDKVRELKKSFNSLTKHSYLERYVEVPAIDEDKVRFLYAMLSEHASKKEAKAYTLAAVLAQAALDVHEAISLHKLQTDSVRKNRQLTVLAGDYYSSLYYYLLAEEKQIPMIRIFSHSIQEINEHKMNIYEADELTYTDAKRNVEKAESILLQNIANHYNQNYWKEIFNDFFFLKRLVFERNEFIKGKNLPIMETLFQEARHPDSVLALCEQKIEDLKDKLLNTSKRLQKYEGFIIEHIDQLINTTDYDEYVAEKG
jgi:heptaprenyl diphosphate synthase